MAKKRKKTKSARLAGFRIPKPLVKTALSVASTRVGRVLIAEALIVAAGILVRKHPVASVSAAGAEAATATRSMAGSASEAAVNFMHAAADRLRSGTGLGDTRKADGDTDKKHGSGRNGSVWDNLDQDTIREALLGEFSRKKKTRKTKPAKRH